MKTVTLISGLTGVLGGAVGIFTLKGWPYVVGSFVVFTAGVLSLILSKVSK